MFCFMICVLLLSVVRDCHSKEMGETLEGNFETDSEIELNRMLRFVGPLMGILRSNGLVRETTESFGSDSWVARAINNNRLRNAIDNRNDRYGGYSGGGGYGGCSGCDEGTDYLGLISLISLGLLFLFLITLLSTTTTGKRKKRSDGRLEEDDNFIDMEHLLADQGIVMLDGPTWLSMVHELWEQDDSPDSIACVQETLCRMNHLAMNAPGQAGWAVSLSSLPLSYLLHARHTGGFASYIDAALMGRSGANCTELYSSCPRLRY